MSNTNTNTSHLLPVDPHANAHPTPALSAVSSTEASPAFTLIESPPFDAVDADLDLGVAATSEDVKPVTVVTKAHLPECWGHRGASATFPENTRASFMEAIKAGADGIETDIHITSDGKLVLFHDPVLSRTTNGTGRIDTQPWEGVLEHVRTTAKPQQPIPLFTEVLDILMLPGNEHVKLNIDCKVENNPTKLFTLIKAAVEAYPGWATKLAPRLVLGIWHPKFIGPASNILSFLPRYAITMSIPEARQYFFKHVHGLSVMYEALASAAGAQFRKDCLEAGKNLCVWTVNGREEMRECVRWGQVVGSVISDRPGVWMKVKEEIIRDRSKALQPTLKTYVLPYLQRKNWWFEHERLAREESAYLIREAGPFEIEIPELSLHIVKPSDVVTAVKQA